MKKFISLILMALLFSSFLPQVNVLASNPYKISMELNTEYSGNIQDYNDTDYYTFTLTKPGRVQINFKHANITDNNDYWDISLSDSNSNILTSFYSSGTDIDLNSNSVGLPAGTYYIEVDDALYRDTSNYTISVKYTEGDFYEKEFNNSVSTANDIIEDKEYIGNIENYNDTDYYKLSIIKPGKVKVNFKHLNVTNNDWCWDIVLLDMSSNVISSFSSKGTDINLTSNGVGLPEGTYYNDPNGVDTKPEK